jgi:cytochrome P450
MEGGTGAAIDFALKASVLGNRLFAKLDDVRAADPVYWSAANNMWLITGHAEVTEALSGTLPFSSKRLPEPALAHIPHDEWEERFPNLLRSARNWLLNVDGREHARQRGLMLKAFGRPVVEGLRPYVQRYVKEALDDLGDRREIEFITDIAAKIPTRTILRQLGLSEDLIPDLRRWAAILNTAGNVGMSLPEIERLEQCCLELRNLILPEIEKRRQTPTQDFISLLVTAVDQGDRLSVDEVVGICQIVLIAGYDTTLNTMALSVAALSHDPAAVAHMRAHPEQSLNSVMELSRFVAMSNLQLRKIGEDFSWKGHHFKAGQYAAVFMSAANRDPKVFDRPDQLDMTRPQEQNMTFAPGAHHCIGHLLAKLQLTEFFPEFLRRYDFELVNDELEFDEPLGFRALKRLPVRLTQRYVA